MSGRDDFCQCCGLRLKPEERLVCNFCTREAARAQMERDRSAGKFGAWRKYPKGGLQKEVADGAKAMGVPVHPWRPKKQKKTVDGTP